MTSENDWTSKKTRSLRKCGLLIISIALSSSVRAADWPQFLGPEANSISSETGINKDWAAKPPKECWRVPMTDEGFSGPAIKGQTVYLHDHLDENDVGVSYTQTFLVPTMIDAPAAAERLELLHELCPLDFPEYVVSAQRGDGLDELYTVTNGGLWCKYNFG